MKIGIDSYCYHRLFGEVYDFQAKPDKLKTVDEFLDFAKELEVDGVSLETCFLPSLDEGFLKDLGQRSRRTGLTRCSPGASQRAGARVESGCVCGDEVAHSQGAGRWGRT